MNRSLQKLLKEAQYFLKCILPLIFHTTFSVFQHLKEQICSFLVEEWEKFFETCEKLTCKKIYICDLTKGRKKSTRPFSLMWMFILIKITLQLHYISPWLRSTSCKPFWNSANYSGQCLDRRDLWHMQTCTSSEKLSRSSRGQSGWPKCNRYLPQPYNAWPCH